jgi:hypothetical protein
MQEGGCGELTLAEFLVSRVQVIVPDILLEVEVSAATGSWAGADEEGEDLPERVVTEPPSLHPGRILLLQEI